MIAQKASSLTLLFFITFDDAVHCFHGRIPKNLNDVLTPLTQKLYKQEAPEGQTEPDVSEDGSSENTVDAEFEEVKEEEK